MFLFLYSGTVKKEVLVVRRRLIVPAETNSFGIGATDLSMDTKVVDQSIA